MSYGYQGPPAPFQGQRPPTSFGAPPGTPSAPGAPPYPQSNLGFNRPPTSFGMPQPFASSPYPQQPNPYGQPQPSPYPSQPSPYASQPSPYPSQPSPYPSQPSPYPSQPSPYPSQPSPYPSQPSPYPSQPSPYPSQPSPYPAQASPQASQPSPYPPKNQASPYPSGPNSSFAGQNPSYAGQNSPYPSGKNAPYPSGQGSSFPGQNSSYAGQNPSFAGQNPSFAGQNPSYAGQNSPYPPGKNSPYPSGQNSSFTGQNPSYAGQNPSYAGQNAYSEASGRPHSSPYPSAAANSSPYPAHPANVPLNSGGMHSGGPGRDGGSIYPSCAGLTSSASPYKKTPAPRRAQYTAKLSPTVVPYDDFDARADAEALRKAMKGFGTDNKTVIEILANRSNLQRQEIAAQFKTLYGKDLIKDLKSELSGNFEDLVVAMMTPIPQYYAKELNNAMSGIGTDECVLIEVLCTMSNHEIRVIKQAYECMYGRTLEDDLRGDTSGNFKRLMVSLCCANRDESFDVDPSAAMEDARQLLQAGELRFGTDESTFNAILVQRNVAQLHQIFTEYQGITGHGIDEAIENEFSGDIKKGLLAIVKCVINRPLFFAEQLNKSMKGIGTDDRRLIRLVVTRSEVDMGEIKQAFVQEYGQTLEDFISDDCSGNYKKCLLALVS